MVGYPYTKYMISIMDVDMAAAVLLCSHAPPTGSPSPAERRVYPRGWWLRDGRHLRRRARELYRSPAWRWRAPRLAGAGIGIDDVAHLDLYSCFGARWTSPSDALGLDPDVRHQRRAVTVTGGLPTTAVRAATT